MNMSEEPNVIKGAETADTCMAPITPASSQEPESQKRHGMEPRQAQEFFNLCLMGIERLSSRQRTQFRRAFKAACRDMDKRWPHGRPMADIEREMKDRQVLPNIIIPEGINPEKLK